MNFGVLKHQQWERRSNAFPLEIIPELSATVLTQMQQLSHGSIELGNGHRDGVFTTSARRYAVPVMTEDVRQPLKAQVHVRHIAHSLNDVGPRPRKQYVGLSGTDGTNDDDGGMKQRHCGVERRSRIIRKQIERQIEVCSHSFHRFFDSLLLGKSSGYRPPNQYLRRCI